MIRLPVCGRHGHELSMNSQSVLKKLSHLLNRVEGEMK